MTTRRARRPARLRTGDAAITRPRRRAALYLRISADREGRELGVKRQEDDGRTLAERRDIDIVRVYCDNDISASNKSQKPRPDYDQMLADAKAGQFDVIIAYTSGRLTRRPMQALAQIDLAENYGIEFVYVASPSFDLNTASGRQIATMLAAQDAAEAETISERVIAAQDQARAIGRRLGGNRPFGYERDGVTIRPHEEALVADAMDRVLAGGSLGSIARHWDRVCPRSEWTHSMVTTLATRDPATLSEQDAALLADIRGRVANAPRNLRLVDDLTDKLTAAWAATDLIDRQIPNGRAWTGQTVRLILTNMRNAGLIEDHDGTLITAQWDAIVTEEQWRAVSALIAEKAKGRESNNQRWIGPRVYRCGVDGCDSDMRNSGTAPLGGKNVTLYRCRAHGHLSIPAAPVDAAVRETAIAILRRDGAALLAKPLAQPDTSALRTQANTLRARLVEARNSYADLKTTEEDWFAIRDRITPQLATLELELAKVFTRSTLTGVADAPDPGAAFLACGPDRQRSMIDELMTITILPGKRGRPFDLSRVVITPKHAPAPDAVDVAA